jgi:hypothetical protein
MKVSNPKEDGNGDPCCRAGTTTVNTLTDA